MRQTNVFWVVVYIGGLEAVHAVKSTQLETGKVSRRGYAEDVQNFLKESADGKVYDPPVHESWPDGEFEIVNTDASVRI